MIRRARDPTLVKYMADAEHMRDLAGRGEGASVVASAKNVVFPELLRICSASTFLAMSGFSAPVQRVLGNFADQLSQVSGGDARAPQGKLVLLIVVIKGATFRRNRAFLL